MKKKIFVIMMTAALLSTSCLHFAEVLCGDDDPTNDRAYIFGFFAMDTYYKKSVVAVLKNTATGEVHYIMYANHPGKPDPLGSVILPVEEGTYRFVEFLACPAVRSLFTIESLDCTSRKSAGDGSPAQLAIPFTVKKGTVTYAGSFSGESYGTNGGKAVSWSTNYTMLPDEEIKKHISVQYPKFSSLPIERAFFNQKTE